MAQLKTIQPGAIIDLVAPASQCDLTLLYQGIDVIKSWGYKPRMPKRLFNSHPYLANEDQGRFEILKQAILTEDSQVIWTVRGGYGSSRLIHRLKKLRPKIKKTFIGYSDSTWLLHFMYEEWGWRGIHGPAVSELATNKLTAKTLSQLKCLLSKPEDIEFTNLKALNSYSLKSGIVKGKICGGSLTILQTTLGTNYSFSGKNKIIFLEEVGERGYSVDRLLIHMLQAGVFKGAKAVIFGEFIGGEETNGKDYTQMAIREFAQLVKFPVLQGMKVGHDKNNWPVLMYRDSQLTLGNKPVLTIKNK